MTIERFALLTGATYYPMPGWCGFIDTFDDFYAAIAQGRECCGPPAFADWWQVVDLATGKIVAGEGQANCGALGYVNAGPPAPVAASAHGIGPSEEEG